MLTVNLRKFRSLSAVYLKDHLPIVVTVDGFKMFVVSAYQDNQARKPVHTAMDEIMALPVYNLSIHVKGDHVRIFDEARGTWFRLIVP